MIYIKLLLIIICGLLLSFYFLENKQEGFDISNDNEITDLTYNPDTGMIDGQAKKEGKVEIYYQNGELAKSFLLTPDNTGFSFHESTLNPPISKTGSYHVHAIAMSDDGRKLLNTKKQLILYAK
jgi:hypothetical protein